MTTTNTTGSLLIKLEVDVKTTEQILKKLQTLQTLQNSCQGFEKRNDFHNTLLFATSFDKDVTPTLEQNCSTVARFQRIDQFGKAVVIVLTDKESYFLNRHTSLKQQVKGNHQHPTYTPHITIGYVDRQLNQSEIDVIANLFNDEEFSFSIEKSKIFQCNN